METAYFIETIIKIVTILLVFSALAGIGTYFERKILAFMQRRLGPMVVGPYGIAQVAADGIKLFTKEDIIPTNVVAKIFKIAPVILPATAFIALAGVPIFPDFEVFGTKCSTRFRPLSGGARGRRVAQKNGLALGMKIL